MKRFRCIVRALKGAWNGSYELSELADERKD
jgi:hypothetical protein